MGSGRQVLLASGWTQTRTYLSNCDLLDIIETKFSTTSKARFDYALDNLGQRASVTKTGEIYTRYGDTIQGLATVYGYNDRSELTSEQTKLGGTATVLTGRDDVHVYDPIGNRSSVAHNGNVASYTANALNQYAARTVPGIFDVAGGAAAAATVTVNGSAAGVTRHGEYFFKGEPMTNDPNPVFSTLAVSDGTTTVNLPAFLAGTPEVITYDEDGNLTRDGRWVFQYDAENRLIAQFTRGAPDDPLAADATNVAVWNSGVARQKLLYTYDYVGRRVSKAVADWDGAGSVWMPALSRQFIYDGWNLMAEFDALSTLTLIKSCLWGLDLSGTLQGAGGVGGLLMVQESGQTYLPLYDAMGNIHGMVKVSDGTFAAAYEYDAFGNTLRESGPFAASNPFRFSTKYTDIETGLVYYGHRFYSPSLGRFINKDPIEEQGGLNLYGFCRNNGVNTWDVLGMDPIVQQGPGARTAIVIDGRMTIFVGGDNFSSGRVGITLGGNQNLFTDNFHSNFFWAESGNGSSSSIGKMEVAISAQNTANQLAAARNAGSLAADSAAAGFPPAAAAVSANTTGQRLLEGGGAVLGLVANGAGVVTAFGLATLPEPTLLSKAGAVALGLKSSYGVGANFQNLKAVILGTPSPSAGGLLGDVTALALPGNQDAQNWATIVDLSADFASGRLVNGAIARRLGQFDLMPSVNRVFIRNPANLGVTVEILQGADTAKNLLPTIQPLVLPPPPPPPPSNSLQSHSTASRDF